MIGRGKRIQKLVGQLLEEERISAPPIDVMSITARRGITIQLADFGEVSGLIVRDGGNITIGVNENHSPNRQRFTVAHELGHLILHSEDPLHVDKVFAVKLRNHVSSEAVDADEIEANAFAAELLMPTDMVHNDLAKESGLLDYEKESFIANLASKYKVSQQAMTIRLINLGYIDNSIG